MINTILKSLVRLINISILSTLKTDKVMKTRLKTSMLQELVLIHGKCSNRKAANSNQFSSRLQIYTNVSPAEMEESRRKWHSHLREPNLSFLFVKGLEHPLSPGRL